MVVLILSTEITTSEDKNLDLFNKGNFANNPLNILHNFYKNIMFRSLTAMHHLCPEI